jgi:hypothetical protein
VPHQIAFIPGEKSSARFWRGFYKGGNFEILIPKGNSYGYFSFQKKNGNKELERSGFAILIKSKSLRFSDIIQN